MEPISPGHPHVIHEGFLHKTPPLDKLFVNWKRRWFVLARTDAFDPSSVELSYYADPMKQGKKGSYPLTKVVKIHPTVSKSKDHSFAVEFEDHKFLLKAPDGNSKNIWVAKLCELSSQDQSFHVTVPYQPTAAAAEASLKLANPKGVLVASPTTGKPLMEIPFHRIRRFGFEVVYGSDVVWFESCECNRKMQEDFHYFVVKSGMEAACQIIHELKTKIEAASGSFAILEKSNDAEVTYKTRVHYGHKEFPEVIRARILQAGLCGLNQTWPMGVSVAGLKGRRQSEFSHYTSQSVAAQGRRHTSVETLLGIGGSPSPHSPSPRSHSPYSSPVASPNHSGSGSKLTLNEMAHRRSPQPSRAYHGSKSDQFDSGVTLDAFDEARNSAPSYISMAAAPSIRRQLPTPSSPSPPMQHKSTLDKFSRRHEKTLDSASENPPPLPSRRITLDHLTDSRVRNEKRDTSASSSHPSSRTFPSKDSSLGMSADFEFEGEHETLANIQQRGPMNSQAYDHLPERTRRFSPTVPPRPLHSLRDSPYVES